MDPPAKKIPRIDINQERPYSLLPQEGPLPNLEKIRYNLYSLCAHEAGLGSMLIAYYYNKQARSTDKLDTGERAHHLIHVHQYYSKLIETIRTLRNKLVHNGFITAVHFRQLVRYILKVNIQELNTGGVNVLLQQMVTEIKRLTYIVVGETPISDLYEKQDIFSGYCPVCRRSDNSNQPAKSAPVVDENNELIVPFESNESNLPCGIAYAFKKTQYCNQLLGRKVQILDGQNAGIIVTCAGWDGPKGMRIYYADGKRGHLPMIRKIQLLPRKQSDIKDEQIAMLAHT